MAAPKKTNTKLLILETAKKLIQDKTVENISLQEICTEASISKGTLYYYYSSKQKLILDLVEYYLEDLAEDLILWIENKDKDTSLKRIIYYVLDKGAHSDRTKVHFYLINNCISLLNEEVRVLFRDKYKEWSMKFKYTLINKLDNQEDAECLANMLLLLIDGILIRELFDDTKVDCNKLALFLSKIK